MCLPKKPYLVMPFDICEARSADGKPLRGSVMNILFMMEFTNSRSKSCEFPLHLFSPYAKDWSLNLQRRTKSQLAERPEPASGNTSISMTLRGGKSSLSIKPFSPQPLCLSKQHNAAKNPKLTQVEHTCSSCLTSVVAGEGIRNYLLHSETDFKASKRYRQVIDCSRPW